MIMLLRLFFVKRVSNKPPMLISVGAITAGQSTGVLMDSISTPLNSFSKHSQSVLPTGQYSPV